MLASNPHFLPVQLVTLPSRIFEDFGQARDAALGIASKSGDPVFVIRFQDPHGAAFFCLATSEQISTPAAYQTSISIVKGGQS